MGKKIFSGKFRYAVLIANITLVVLVIVLGIQVFRQNYGSRRVPKVKAVDYSDEEINQMSSEASDTMSDIYDNVLRGSSAVFDDGNEMHFGYDGTFSGYFDAEHPDVSGYVFRVTETEDGDSYLANVNVYNESQSSYVQYKLLLSADKSSFRLYYPGDDSYISLAD